jgi:hypothetical protein
MKSLLSFAAGLLMMFTATATDHRPSVSIRSGNHYEVYVDGRKFSNNHQDLQRRLHPGRHTVSVFQRQQGFFGQRLRLVSTRNFVIRNNDLRIIVDRFGQVHIEENRNYRGYERNWDYRDRDEDEYYRQEDRGRKNGNRYQPY